MVPLSCFLRVESLKSHLDPLLPRLEGAYSTATEAHEVVAMENHLEELEAWLVSSGKFYSNQQIIRQIQDHKVRNHNMPTLTPLPSSPPPPPPRIDGCILMFFSHSDFPYGSAF